MPSFKQTMLLKHNLQNIYQLITDVEAYPEFLPWCEGVEIVERNGTNIIAELSVKFAGLFERYTSHITFKDPADGVAGVDVIMIHGPFKHLNTVWTLTAVENNMVQVEFSIDFCFKSILLEQLAEIMLPKACKKVTEAFIKRADALYRQL